MPGEQKTRALTLEEIKSRRKKRNEAWEAKQRAFKAQTLARQTAQLRTMGEAARRHEAELQKTKLHLAVQTAQRQAAEKQAAAAEEKAAAADGRAKEEHALAVQKQKRDFGFAVERRSRDRKEIERLSNFIRQEYKNRTSSEQEKREKLQMDLKTFSKMVDKIRNGSFVDGDVEKTEAALASLDGVMQNILEGEAMKLAKAVRVKLATENAALTGETANAKQQAKRAEFTDAAAGILLFWASAQNVDKAALKDYFEYRQIDAAALAKTQEQARRSTDTMRREQLSNVLLEKCVHIVGQVLFTVYGKLLSLQLAGKFANKIKDYVPAMSSLSTEELAELVEDIPFLPIWKKVGWVVAKTAGVVNTYHENVMSALWDTIKAVGCLYALVLTCRAPSQAQPGTGSSNWIIRNIREICATIQGLIPSFDGVKQFALMTVAQTVATRLFSPIAWHPDVPGAFRNFQQYIHIDVAITITYCVLVMFWEDVDNGKYNDLLPSRLRIHQRPQLSPETEAIMAEGAHAYDTARRAVEQQKQLDYVNSIIIGDTQSKRAEEGDDQNDVPATGLGATPSPLRLTGGEAKDEMRYFKSAQQAANFFDRRTKAEKHSQCFDWLQWTAFKAAMGSAGGGIALAGGQNMWMGVLLGCLVKKDKPVAAAPTPLYKSHWGMLLALTIVPSSLRYAWDMKNGQHWSSQASPHVAIVFPKTPNSGVSTICANGKCYSDALTMGMIKTAACSQNQASSSLTTKIVDATKEMARPRLLDASIMSLTGVPNAIIHAQAVRSITDAFVVPQMLASRLESVLKGASLTIATAEQRKQVDALLSYAKNMTTSINNFWDFVGNTNTSVARKAVPVLLTADEATMLLALDSVFTTAPDDRLPANSSESESMLQSFVQEASRKGSTMPAETKVRKGVLLLSQNQVLREHDDASDTLFVFKWFTTKSKNLLGLGSDLTATAKEAQTVVNKALGEVVAKKDEERRASQALPITIDQRMAEAQAEAQKQLTDYWDWLRGTCRAFPEDMLGPPTNQDPAQKLGQCPADAENDVTQTLLNQISTNSNGTTVSGQGDGAGGGLPAIGLGLHPPVSRPLRVSYTVPYTAPYATRVSYASYPPNAAPQHTRAQRPSAITRERDPERKC